jgi:anti-anti-sigma factor
MANSFTIDHRPLDAHTCLITVEGDLDLASAPQLKWALVELSDKGYQRYVIDLARLTHIDSTGLGVFVGFSRRLAGSAHLALACLPAAQRRVLEITGLDATLDSFATVEEALATPAGALPFGTDAAMAVGLASTAMPFAASRRAEALRWLRILRLHGEAARVLCALGVGEAPLPDGVPADAGDAAQDDRDARDSVAAVSELAVRLARKRGATAVGTGDILLSVLRFYGPDFDAVLTAHGTDRDEVAARLAA